MSGGCGKDINQRFPRLPFQSTCTRSKQVGYERENMSRIFEMRDEHSKDAQHKELLISVFSSCASTGSFTCIASSSGSLLRGSCTKVGKQQ